MDRPINEEGMALLEASERFVGHAYPDPYSSLGKALQKAGLWKKYLKAPFPIPDEMRALSGAPWTIGLGFTKGVQEGDKMTRREADRRFDAEMDAEYVQPILRACKVDANENQLAAMACLAWNIGIGAFLKSTVLKAHNRSDFAAAARAFGLFNKSKGEVSEGLTTRRALESALYRKPVEQTIPEPLPQAVQPEGSLAKSPIIAGSTITAGTATVATVAEGARGVKDIRESLGDWLPIILLVVILGAAGWAIYARFKQRRGGWA